MENSPTQDYGNWVNRRLYLLFLAALAPLYLPLSLSDRHFRILDSKSDFQNWRTFYQSGGQKGRKTKRELNIVTLQVLKEGRFGVRGSVMTFPSSALRLTLFCAKVIITLTLLHFHSLCQQLPTVAYSCQKLPNIVKKLPKTARCC